MMSKFSGFQDPNRQTSGAQHTRRHSGGKEAGVADRYGNTRRLQNPEKGGRKDHEISRPQDRSGATVAEERSR